MPKNVKAPNLANLWEDPSCTKTPQTRLHGALPLPMLFHDWVFLHYIGYFLGYPLVIEQVAIENCHLQLVYPLKC
jgi:hypothetical protein